MGGHEGIGEFELIARLRDAVRAAGAPDGENVLLASGDDAAVLRAGEDVVVSVDALVEGVHFTRPEFPLDAIGHKALATALSDLAAMGARPGEAFVVLGLTEDLAADGAAIDVLAAGLGSCAASHGVAVAGGDVTRAPALALAVTVIGRIPSSGAALTRAGANAGDVVAVTGELGGAAAGLLLLRGDIRTDEPEALIERQLRPAPRLAAGAALAASGATACIDLSDGLAGDGAHLARASEVRIVIDAGAVPLQRGVTAVAEAGGRDPLDLALAGGEDYELLASVPPERFADAAAAVRAAGVGLTRIGVVATAAGGAGLEITAPDGGRLSVAGFDQLRGSQSAAEA